MSQSSYLSPLLWLKKEADKEKMSATQCQIFFFYYQMFELLFARESDMKDLCLGTKGFYFSQLEKKFAFWSFPISKKLGGESNSQG